MSITFSNGGVVVVSSVPSELVKEAARHPELELSPSLSQEGQAHYAK